MTYSMIPADQTTAAPHKYASVRNRAFPPKPERYANVVANAQQAVGHAQMSAFVRVYTLAIPVTPLAVAQNCRCIRTGMR